MEQNGHVSFKEVEEARQRIGSYVYQTPVFTSSQANAKSGRELFFKAENLQKTGSFKIRGAMNAILKLKEAGNCKGVVSHSSGNHGQGIAYAASLFDVPIYVVVAKTCPEVKKEAIRGYKATLVEAGIKAADRFEMCERLQKEKGLTYISSYDNYDVIAGTGTIAMEFLEQIPELDAIFVSVSGGGLSAGIAVAAKHIKPSIKIFLVTPKGKGLEECLRAGKRLYEGSPQYLDTIADGIRLHHAGFKTMPYLLKLAEKDVFEVSDEEMIEAMKFSFERMKLVIEAAAGATFAAVLSDKLHQVDPEVKLKKIGVVLCGGNVDIDHLPW